MTFQWGRLDAAKKAREDRAINISNSGTTLVQVNINRAIQQLSLRYMGALSTLPVKPGSGNAAYINRRTVGTTGAEWVADTDSLTEETGTYAQASFPYRTAATRLRVTRAAQAKGKSYADLIATELMFKNEDYDNAIENALFQGDSGASGDADSINGLLTLICATAAQVVANTSGTSGASVVLDKLDETIDVTRSGGSFGNLMIYGSQKAIRRLNAAMVARQMYNDVTEVAAGFRVQTYNGIPVIPTTGLPDALVWNGTNKITAFSGGTTSCFVVVSMRDCWIEELTPKTVAPLALTDSQYTEIDMYRDFTLVLANTKSASLLAGIA